MGHLQFWTDFADGSVMFPLGVAVPLILAIAGQRRAAIGWTAAVGGVWAVMLVLKIMGYAIVALYPTSPFSELDLVTPSGHVASSAVIYGGLIGLLLARPGSLLRRSNVAASGVAAGIASTRVLLGVHSLAEVIVGAAVGILGAAGLGWAAGRAVRWEARLPLLAASAVIIGMFHGHHTSAEDPIQDVALRIVQYLDHSKR